MITSVLEGENGKRPPTIHKKHFFFFILLRILPSAVQDKHPGTCCVIYVYISNTNKSRHRTAHSMHVFAGMEESKKVV